MDFNKDIEYIKAWNEDLALTKDEQEAISIHNRCIRAYELLIDCYRLFKKQQDSPYVLNLFEETLFNLNDKGSTYEYDSYCVFEDIKNLLIESGEIEEE